MTETIGLDYEYLATTNSEILAIDDVLAEI